MIALGYNYSGSGGLNNGQLIGAIPVRLSSRWRKACLYPNQEAESGGWRRGQLKVSIFRAWDLWFRMRDGDDKLTA